MAPQCGHLQAEANAWATSLRAGSGQSALKCKKDDDQAADKLSGGKKPRHVRGWLWKRGEVNRSVRAPPNGRPV